MPASNLAIGELPRIEFATNPCPSTLVFCMTPVFPPVFGPTLLKTTEGSASLSSLVDTVHQTRVVELLTRYQNCENVT